MIKFATGKDQIEKKNPLKQGLKPYAILPFFDQGSNWKEESIKTRIETSRYQHTRAWEPYWKEESIKTRIETSSAYLILSFTFYWKEESIKTRIETIACWPLMHAIWIEKKNPLKQGLKLQDRFYLVKKTRIEKKNPLKQGLKHFRSRNILFCSWNWKEESIKTRIETWAPSMAKTPVAIEKKNPLKQGLKPVFLYPKAGDALLKRRIH